MTDHLHEAGETIAKAVKATVDPHSGWLKYAPADEPGPTYTGEQVLKWLTRNLDLSDKAEDRTKEKALTRSPATSRTER